MGRALKYLFRIAILAAIGIAMVYFGAFPPTPAPHHVERTVPNDQIKGQ